MVMRVGAPAPFGLERQYALGGTELDPAKIVAIAVDHQVDPRARSNLEALEPRRQSTLGQPEQREDEVG